MSGTNAPMTEAMYYILLALRQPCHGYGIMQQITEVSRGRISMGPGTLYGVLTRMRKDGWIRLQEDDGRRKVYYLTASGEEALQQEYGRLKNMVADGMKAMQAQ